MEKILKDLIKEKRILILGFGREGRSTLKALKEVGGYKSITVSDSKDVSKDLETGFQLVYGEGYLDVLDDYDVCFKSPGIVLPKDRSQYKTLITSETEVFIEAYKEQIIGITGTKGKSTTSSLLYHVLKTAGKDVLFAGNIGLPVFEIYKEIKPETLIVIELSCHQLEYALTSPKRGVILNIYEDHLDHYGTREKYAEAKLNLCKNQTEKDIFYTIKEVTDEFGSFAGKLKLIDRSELPIKDFGELSGVSLRGSHNLLNAAFVYVISQELGVSDRDFLNALTTFEPLPHRLEYVGKINDIDYYDDSISTTVKSTISAVESINNAATILIGGMERNIDYTELVSYLSDSKIKNIICMYESGDRFYRLFKAYEADKAEKKNLVSVKDLAEAVAASKKVTLAGEAVLLSPASASYGYFKNFEERGEVFKKLVKS